jgi:hypothetical protein
MTYMGTDVDIPYIARELDRQLAWIEQQARDLQAAVEQLINEARALMNDDGTWSWNEQQADIIRRAVNDLGDNCGRSIGDGCNEVHEFNARLYQAQWPRNTE